MNGLPNLIPIFPLAGALLLPGCRIPLNIFEPRYIQMIDDSFKTDRLIGLIQPISDSEATQAHPELARIGCVGRLVQFEENGDRYLITLLGISRFELKGEAVNSKAYREGIINYSSFANELERFADKAGVNRDELLRTFREFSRTRNISLDWKNFESVDTSAIVNALAMHFPFGLSEKQALLEARDQSARAEMLITLARLAWFRLTTILKPSSERFGRRGVSFEPER